MSDNFEKILDRTDSSSAKWSKEGLDFSQDIVPFTVADLDFALPQPLREGLSLYLETAVLGYDMPTNTYYQAVINWFHKKHHFEVQKEWILTSPGVLPAISNAIQAFSDIDDKVMIFSPVYGPFSRIINNLNRTIYPIHFTEDFSINLEEVEKGFKEGIKLLILCSPHNPIGKVWSFEFLEALSLLVDKYKVLVIADEIHADLILPQYEHYIYASINEKALNHSVICTSSSKTFNLAGLNHANIFIANEKLRQKYIQTTHTLENGTLSTNTIARKANELVYLHCFSWQQSLMQLVEKNYKMIVSYFRQHLPEVKIIPLEGTYLLWIDFRGLITDEKKLIESLEGEQIFLSEGSQFGENAIGFMRMNIAYPSKIIEKTLPRFKKALV